MTSFLPFALLFSGGRLGVWYAARFSKNHSLRAGHDEAVLVEETRVVGVWLYGHLHIARTAQSDLDGCMQKEMR